MSVRVYMIEQEIDGQRYSSELCARSFEEANEMASRIGAKVNGTVEEQQCAQCGNVIREGSQVLGDNEWPEEINA